MSADSRKRQKKVKNESQEQRKPRIDRVPVNLPPDKKQELPKEKQTDVNDESGLDFYKNLKRETDEIIKITEESDAKYSKRVIQSVWQKYEAPIESYEERDEVENMGADFEKLINAPLSSGGHFQFKHEKSWDTTLKSTEHDKCFDIDMSALARSILTIPFNERNDMDIDLFSESDRISMAHTANKFKKLCQYGDETEKDADPTEKVLIQLKDALVIEKKYYEGEHQPGSKSIMHEDNNFVEMEVEPEIKSRETEVYSRQNVDIIGSIEGSTQKRMVDDDEHKGPENIASEIKKLAGGDNTRDDEEDLEGWLDDFLSSPDCMKH